MTVALHRAREMAGSLQTSARLYVGAITITVSVATFALVGWLALNSAHMAQAQLEADAARKAILISGSLDRAVSNMKNAATALAGSHELQVDNLRDFHHRAVSFGRSLGIQIVVRDVESERQVVNTSVEWGERLPSGGIQAIQAAEGEALRTGMPRLSDVFFGPLSKTHLVVVFAPVTSTSGKHYSLSVGIETKRFTEHLDRAQLGAHALVTVLDRRGTIVTRSQQHDEFTGRTLSRDQLHVDERSRWNGVARGINLAGVPFQWNFTRSQHTEWVVNVGTPISVLEKPVNDAIVMLGIAGAALLLLAMAGIHFGSARLVRRMGRLGIDRPPTREEFRTLFESVPYGVVVVDTSAIVVLTNARMDAKFGYAREELIGRSIDVLVPERFRGFHVQSLRDCMSAPDAHAMGAGRELCGRRKDGSEFPVEIGLQPISAGRQSFVLATVIDISVRKRERELAAAMLAEREEFQRRLIRAEEAERLRLAHELHDETGQSLTAVSLALKSLESCVTETGMHRLRAVQGQLAALGKSLHDVARQMRPTSLEDLGLGEALSNHAADWSERCGVAVDLQQQCNLDEVTSEHAVVIFRVAQEALTNVARHARGATTVSIVAYRVDDQLRLIIEDDGCGFSQAEATLSPHGGIGIPGMRERLALVGGELEIESSVSQGTTLYARIPLQRQKESA